MSWSLKLGRVFGIDVKMHLTFLLILAWGAFAYGGSAGPLYGIAITLGLFGLVFLHELGHSLAAMGYGIKVRDITLLPIGGVARLERMPEKPVQELVVALAGPAVNVVLAVALLPVVALLSLAQGVPLTLATFGAAGPVGFLTFLLMANVSLAIFNMIPAFPLDGGRVFRALLGFFTSYQQATQVAATTGRVLAVGLGLFAIFVGQFWLAMIALFIFFVGGQEAKAVVARGVLRQAQAGQAMARDRVALSPQATVGEVAPMMFSHRQNDFVVLDPANGEFLGVATSGNILQAAQQGQWHRRVSDIMQQARHIPTVAINTTLDEVQDKLAESSSRVVAVYDGLHFRGLISVEDIYRMARFLSQSGMGSRRVSWQSAS
jgi:Zn-dependent protease/CBS domain-containing protein